MYQAKKNAKAGTSSAEKKREPETKAGTSAEKKLEPEALALLRSATPEALDVLDHPRRGLEVDYCHVPRGLTGGSVASYILCHELEASLDDSGLKEGVGQGGSYLGWVLLAQTDREWAFGTAFDVKSIVIIGLDSCRRIITTVVNFEIADEIGVYKCC